MNFNLKIVDFDMLLVGMTHVERTNIEKIEFRWVIQAFKDVFMFSRDMNYNEPETLKLKLEKITEMIVCEYGPYDLETQNMADFWR